MVVAFLTPASFDGGSPLKRLNEAFARRKYYHTFGTQRQFQRWPTFQLQ
jgi:hypothetical protein